MKQQQPINFLFTINDRYAPHMAATIVSLLKSQKRNLYFHILHSNLSDESIDKIGQLKNIKEFSAKYYQVKDNIAKKFPITLGHITYETYFRLFAHEYIENCVSKIIHLDVDLLVFRDLGELWDHPLDNNFATGTACRKMDGSHLIPVGFNPRVNIFFYAGVNVLNLKLMREENISQEVDYIVRRYGYLLRFQDQDIMNILFKGRIAETPLSYNSTTPVFMHKGGSDEKVMRSQYGKEDFEEALTNPHIVHFSREIKPWHRESGHPWRKYYWQYLQETPWRNRKPEEYCRFENKSSFINLFFNWMKGHIKKILKSQPLKPLKYIIIYTRGVLRKWLQKKTERLLKTAFKKNVSGPAERLVPLGGDGPQGNAIGHLFPDRAYGFYSKDILNCQFVDNMEKASTAMVWGIRAEKEKYRFLKNAIKKDIPIMILEDGFIRSCQLGSRDPGLSCIPDYMGVFYSDKLGSSIHRLLDSNWAIEKEQKNKSKTAMNFIFSHHLSKYNFIQPEVINFNINHKYKSISLVLDQRKGDMSIEGAQANKKSFKKMLDDAIKENRDGLILIKIHPDAMNLPQHTGYYTYLLSKSLGDNVRLLSRNINPISLLKSVDKVYTVSSTMGFEALMCRKKVYCYGWPFYAGRGITEDRGEKRKRVAKKRSLEEIFYTAYIKSTLYFNPRTLKRCDIFEAMEYIIRERDSLKIENKCI